MRGEGERSGRPEIPAGAIFPLVIGDLAVDLGRREVWVGGRRIQLTFSEFELLCCLASNRSKVVLGDTLLRAVSADRPGTRGNLAVHVSRLRKKLAGGRCAIQTVRKRGYFLVDVDGEDQRLDHG